MVRALVTSLEALADAGDAPLDGSALARAFEDAWFVARQCPGLEWTPQQRDRLDALDGALATLTTEDREWPRIRRLAREALAAIAA